MQLFPDDLIAKLKQVKQLVVLTGAGTSAESGIPTFREAQTGLWAQYDPAQLATPEAFKQNPKLVWDWYTWRREKVLAAQPNAGHLALVAMEKYIKTFHLVTQNVDGLHQRAGSENVLELHGNITRIKCEKRQRFIDLSHAQLTEYALQLSENTPPRCLDCNCNSFYRPDVVWFGESLPYHALVTAEQVASQCEMLLCIGTSSVVYPAAALPLTAQQNGATVVEINYESTPLTKKAHYFLKGMSGEILPALVKAVWEDGGL